MTGHVLFTYCGIRRDTYIMYIVHYYALLLNLEFHENERESE